MASPPFSVATTSPLDSDLLSIFPTQEHPFRDTVLSWLTLLSDPTTGLLKATALTIPFVMQNAAAGTFFEWESQDAGATEGPSLSLYRNSASPAAADILGVLRWNGKDSAANKQEYANIRVNLVDPVSTTEDATMIQSIVVNGALTDRITMNAAGVTIAGTLTYAGSIAGLVGTGALDSGSITANFGSINIGSDPITAGAATFTTITAAGAVTGVTSLTMSGALSGGTTASFSSTGTFTGNLQGAAVISTSNIFANSAAATMNLRPSGSGSTTGQMTIATNGNVTAAGDITASSDRRLKKSIAPINHQWANDMVREVEAKSFLRKKSDTRSLGFIAQDVQPYAPELVHEDDHGMLSLAYPNMVAILWAVVQDLQQKVQELEARPHAAF